MKNKIRAILAVVLCLTLVFAVTSPAFAKDDAVTGGTIPEVDNFVGGIFDSIDEIGTGAEDGSFFLSDEFEVDGETYNLKTPEGMLALLGTVNSLQSLISSVWRILNFALLTLMNGVVIGVPDSASFKDLDTYDPENFYDGTDEFLTEAAEGNVWSLGYSQASLIPDDFGQRAYYMGGYDVGKASYSTYDDIKVRTICLEDGSGRGITSFSVIDTVGFANSDIREIRSRVADYAEANGIDFAAINVSVTHTHSGFDTQGIWASQPQALVTALENNVTFTEGETTVDPVLLENIYAKVTQSVIDAYNDMTEGTLHYSKKDASQYWNDKSDPDIFISDIYRLRFDPFDGSTETIIANFGAHPETVGYISGDNPGDVISSDFVYYTERVINDAGYDFIFIQGAIGSLISCNRGLSGDGLPINRYQSCVRYGEELGFFILGMTLTEEECIAQVVDKEREEDDLSKTTVYTPWYEGWTAVTETEVEPYFNIGINQVLFQIDNPLLVGIGKLGMANNTMLLDEEGNVYTYTEVGYIEFGNSVKVLMMPGETAPELIVGGKTMTSEGSVSGTDFIYPPVREMISGDLIVFDVMNDSVGYIVPDNDYGIGTIRYYDDESFTYNTDGMLSFGGKAASTFITEFLDIVDTKSAR